MKKRAGPRSIPACTGEPVLCRDEDIHIEVYPRVYGGTLRVTISGTDHEGLSPRVRGNRGAGRGRQPGVGSIPACTGEPVQVTEYPQSSAVYPRVYGGTTTSAEKPYPLWGLSPRVRGNQLAQVIIGPSRGSIPACTGEPVQFLIFLFFHTVYPRVYGGTPWRVMSRNEHEGLSPRVRGNRVNVILVEQMVRSIPACTGEPTLAWCR